MTYRTRDLARSAAISTQLVRDYEAEGFIPPAERSPNGYRRFTARHLTALQTARALIEGYGRPRAGAILLAAHTGRLADALALIDARHAELDRSRTQLDQTLNTLSTLIGRLPGPSPLHPVPRLRIGDAARLVGVRVSAVRFWEQQGLLHPERAHGSRYRAFDDHQIRRLRIVVLLRQANYDFASIRTTLTEVEADQPENAVAAIERRRHDVAAMSWRCLRALAAFHHYVATYLDADARLAFDHARPAPTGSA